MTTSMVAYRMTFALLWGLVILWLLAGARGADAGAQTQPAASAATPPWPSTVQGYDQTLPKAREDAMRKAIEEMTAYLRLLQPPIVYWQPTEKYLKERILADSGLPGPDLDIKDLGPVKSWVLTLKTPDLVQLAKEERKAFLAYQEQERQVVTQDRLILAGRGFLTCLVALAIVNVTGRLRRWSRGRFQVGLNLTALLLIVVSGAAIWWRR